MRWQREGRRTTSQIFQTEDGARAKAARLVELEHLKRGGEGPPSGGVTTGFEYMDPDYFIDKFGDMPDLVGPPEIQHREVEAWEPA